MTWRKWWILEILFGIGALVAMSPLNWTRFAVAGISMTLFAVCYLKRVMGQILFNEEKS